MSRSVRILLLVPWFALFTGTVAAQGAYPSKPISIVVAFPPGGPTDVIARTIGVSMQKSLGQQITVENVSGAGGTVGVGRVARAAPDGYSLVLHHIGMATAPTLYRKLAYDPLQDFIPIGSIADVPMTIVARGDFPAQSFAEMLAHVKANGTKLTYANAGIGSASHLCGLVFMQAIQTQLTTVPYKGTQPAMTDLLGGRVDLLCDQTTQTTAQIRAGKIKAYAVTTRARVSTLPELPSLHELGLRDFNIAIWHVLYAPKATPKEAVDKLVRALQVALADPIVKQRFNELGTDPQPAERATPDNARALVKSEIERWAPIIRQAGQFAD
jgi:tripartite-type tricarboxylate transporter receptor subunit TctC